MFTGLIQKTGVISSVKRRSGGGLLLGIDHEKWTDVLLKGESVAVNGACLTVTDVVSRACFTCDCLDETLRNTSISTLVKGDLVNLERALALGDRLGGHLVSGHVDGTGIVSAIRPDGPDFVVRVQCSPILLAGMVLKGSIALDGISLTISALQSDAFEVSVIPHTWNNTTLNRFKSGRCVNLETDMIGKYLKRFMHIPEQSKIDEDMLRSSGFIK